MRSDFFKYTGLNSSFLALLMLLVTPALEAQPSLDPSVKPVKECRDLTSLDPAAFEPMKEFWRQAWGEELEVGTAGMALQETGSPGIWDLLVSSKVAGRWVDHGTFTEEARHAIDLRAEIVDQVYLNATKMTSFDRYVVAGTVTGSTGSSMSVTALVSELQDDSGNSIRSFAVIQWGVDPAASMDFADATAKRLNGDRSADIGSKEISFDKSGGNQACVNACVSTRNGQLQLCESAKDSCIAIAIGVAAACAIACAASTIALPICLAACDLVLAGSLGLCATNAATCNNAAWTQYYNCLNGCDCSVSPGNTEKIFC